MTKILNKRLDELTQRIRAIPIPTAVVRAAYERFRTKGDLPDDVRLAYAVVRRAKRGDALSELYETETDWGALIQASMSAPKRPEDPLMDELYDEAVFATGVVRTAARFALRTFATVGLDPTQPQFVGTGRTIPDYGGVGLHVLGIPERMVRAPYKAQARRLFRRAERLREATPQGDRRWSQRLDEAIQRFQTGGDWPEDPLVLDWVLAAGELAALIQHACGEDAAAILAAFDTAARATGEERREAIARVQDLAVAAGEE